MVEPSSHGRWIGPRVTCTQAVVWAVAITSFVWLMLLVASAGDGDVDCGDLTYQEDAQQVFDARPGDPYGLDKDKDSVACENLPHAR